VTDERSILHVSKSFNLNNHPGGGGLMSMAEQIIATTTRSHTIEVVNGSLTIRGEQESLAPDEVEQLLDALLIWRYGLEELPLDESEN
jgi:hypothetical protein